MKDQLPSPDFDSSKYERPNQDWVCGWACEGKPCRIGPDAKGNCRATYECKPALELREGETKGRFKCTRPKEFGGPCEHGPLADGTCSRAVPRCQPKRSLRAKRGIFTLCIVALTVGGLLVAFFGSSRLHVISPGKISTQHAATQCADCHNAAASHPAHWSQVALAAEPSPLQFASLVQPEQKFIKRIDQSCQGCHTHHNFHEPNVVRDFSCSECHQEHLGAGPMRAPNSDNCLACHANSQIMEASFQKGKTLPHNAFDFRADHGQLVFKTPRPDRGFTKVFHAFAIDHPEFEIHAQQLKDTDTLRFNHQLHLGDTVRTKNGGKLNCADCHKPDTAGAFYQKISFENNCRECHSLQFDKHNPELQLPHGNPETVRAFLRSLEIQYADFGRKKGVTEQRALKNFVQAQLQNLRAEKLSGETLEQQVFFSAAKKSLDERALYPGCAYCHEVKSRGDLAPAITHPRIPDRWLPRARFDHSKHINVSCTQCHDARKSLNTDDVLLPTKSSCVTCHSPKGGVRSDCATCHGFHSNRSMEFTSIGLNAK